MSGGLAGLAQTVIMTTMHARRDVGRLACVARAWRSWGHLNPLFIGCGIAYEVVRLDCRISSAELPSHAFLYEKTLDFFPFHRF